MLRYGEACSAVGNAAVAARGVDLARAVYQDRDLYLLDLRSYRDGYANLSAIEADPEGPDFALWQDPDRQHLGLEQDWGCRALATVPSRFTGDRDVLVAFKKFHIACRRMSPLKEYSVNIRVSMSWKVFSARQHTR